MTVASTTSSRWVVSTRTDGEVLSAGVTASDFEIVLLGIPPGFTTVEIEAWLRDLAGVAAETSRADSRVRAIPLLLHHGLTGLLFSQAELWSRLGLRGPCAAAFVETRHACAFGWVGDARATVTVDGRRVEPQWVLVRDEDGRTGRAMSYPVTAQVSVTLEYWPEGEDGTASPGAIEGEWTPAGSERLPSPAGTGAAPAATAEPPAERAAMGAPGQARASDPLPESLPTQQPGLANALHGIEVFPDDAASAAPPSADGPAELAAVTDGAAAADPGASDAERDARASDPFELEPRAKPMHPIGRWLSRLLGWGRRPTPRTGSPALDKETPVSKYDAIMSEPSPSPEDALALLEDPNLDPIPLVPLDAEIGSSPGAPAVAGPSSAPSPGPAAATAPSQPLPAAPDPGAFATSAAPAAPNRDDTIVLEPLDVPPQHASALAAVLRAMREADAAALPRLSTPALPPSAGSGQPIAVDREPVGAAEDFAIAPLPALPAAAPSTAGAPPAPPATGELAPPVLAQLAPPVLRVPPPAPSAGPPRLNLGPGAAPPTIQVSGSAAERGVMPIIPGAPLFVGEAEEAAHVPSRAPRTPWPVFEETASSPADWVRRRWPWFALAVGALLVFAMGWMLGGQTSNTPGPFANLVRALGLAGSRYQAVVSSAPAGAWISVDGKDATQRTPATLDLVPGEHVLTLTLPDLGSSKVSVHGQKGDRVTVEEALNGSLEILSDDPGMPLAVALDGKAQGYAPLKLESLPPGLHEVQFSGPGIEAWAQTAQVGVHKVTQLVAHPMSTPANGVIQVQALMNDDQGSTPLAGAQVFVDGQLRGLTPMSVELPRGPHSLRLSYRDETAAVQVIDLPGGNQRYASFNFGLASPAPGIRVIGFTGGTASNPTQVLSAAAEGMQPSDIREAWLHVRAPEGLWRRYPMSVMGGPTGAVLVSVFPAASSDGRGKAAWYVSANSGQGDEYFSELEGAVAAPVRPSPARVAPAPPARRARAR